jgi:hypothetical protein
MPSKSPAQARLMAAAAHTPGGYGGVPQSVGKEFNQADKGGKLLRAKRPKRRSRPKAGPSRPRNVLGM